MSKRNSKKEAVWSEASRAATLSEAPEAADAGAAPPATSDGGDEAAVGDTTDPRNAGGDDYGSQVNQASAAEVVAESQQAVEDVDPAQQVAELRDELLRRQADYENFRKRMNREKEEAIKFANSALLMDLTAVIDDFERAIQSSQDSNDVTALRSGLELIEKQLTGMLERKWGLSRFGSEGEPFDPERHEALAQEPSTVHDVDTVVEEYQKGFLLHGRVVRAARVRVATPSASGGATLMGGASESGEAEGDQ